MTLRNLTGRPLTGELVLPYGRAIDPAHEEKPSFFGGVGNLSDAACFVKDGYEHETVKDKLETKEHSGPVRWVGINQQYFLSAIFPVGTRARRAGACSPRRATERIATGRFPVQVGPGQAVTRAFGAFLGPKDTKTLADVPELPANRSADAASAPVHLERAVDYGIWAALCKPMLVVLKWFHGVVGNWGVAIILLTVLVKVLLIPLTHRAMVGQEAMKKLQPKIEEVKRKYPGGQGTPADGDDEGLPGGGREPVRVVPDDPGPAAGVGRALHHAPEQLRALRRALHLALPHRPDHQGPDLPAPGAAGRLADHHQQAAAAGARCRRSSG